MTNNRITAYEGSENYIFISYAHKDTDKVFPIMEKLCGRGYRLWYDDGIAPGSEWPEDIARHLNNSAMVIAFVSPNSMASVNCRREINFALSKQKPFLSVILEPTEMPLGMELQLSAQQSVLRHNYRSEETFIEKICACPDLERCRAAEPQPVAATVPEYVFERSETESRLDSSLETSQLEKVRIKEPKKEKTEGTRSAKISGKTLGIVAGIAVAIIAAVIAIFAFSGKKNETPPNVSVETQAVQEDTFVIHAQVPKLWGRVDLWAWSSVDGREAFDAKPGKTMEKDAQGWYTGEAPAWVNRIRLNGNYATMETPDISLDSKEVWIVIHEDLSYELSYEGPFESTITVYARVPDSWDAPHCWAWSKEKDAFDAWPGKPMTKQGDWYVTEVPSWITGIVINNDTIQSGDIYVDSGWDVWIVEQDEWWVGFYQEPTAQEIQEAFKQVQK